ncbi:Translation initiation factor IF-2, partial [Ophiophagus hannah]
MDCHCFLPKTEAVTGLRSTSWFCALRLDALSQGCQTHIFTTASCDVLRLFSPSLNRVWAWPALSQACLKHIQQTGTPHPGSHTEQNSIELEDLQDPFQFYSDVILMKVQRLGVLGLSWYETQLGDFGPRHTLSAQTALEIVVVRKIRGGKVSKGDRMTLRPSNGHKHEPVAKYLNDHGDAAKVVTVEKTVPTRSYRVSGPSLSDPETGAPSPRPLRDATGGWRQASNVNGAARPRFPWRRSNRPRSRAEGKMPKLRPGLNGAFPPAPVAQRKLTLLFHRSGDVGLPLSRNEAPPYFFFPRFPSGVALATSSSGRSGKVGGAAGREAEKILEGLLRGAGGGGGKRERRARGSGRPKARGSPEVFGPARLAGSPPAPARGRDTSLKKVPSGPDRTGEVRLVCARRKPPGAGLGSPLADYLACRKSPCRESCGERHYVSLSHPKRLKDAEAPPQHAHLLRKDRLKRPWAVTAAPGGISVPEVGDFFFPERQSSVTVLKSGPQGRPGNIMGLEAKMGCMPIFLRLVFILHGLLQQTGPK